MKSRQLKTLILLVMFILSGSLLMPGSARAEDMPDYTIAVVEGEEYSFVDSQAVRSLPQDDAVITEIEEEPVPLASGESLEEGRIALMPVLAGVAIVVVIGTAFLIRFFKMRRERRFRAMIMDLH